MTPATRPLGMVTSAVAAVAALLLLAACHHATGPTPVPTGKGLLAVTAVDVAVRESFPPQVEARVTGEVPNVCTAVKEIQQRRDGRTIALTISTYSATEVCILLLPPPVQLAVPLAGPFESGEYLLRVNGVERRFRI